MADNKTPHPPSVAQPDSSEDLWLVSYADDDDRELTATQIAAALERGEIDANTIVWRDGMPEWKAIAEVEGLRSQLRRLSHAPENLRRRQTVLGGFGAARPPQPVTPAPVIAATSRASFGGFDDDDDEPTVIQPSLVEGFTSAPNHVRPDPSPQRGRHPTSGNTLRIKTGDPGPVRGVDPGPVTPRAPTHDRITPTDMSRQHLAADFGFGSSPRAAAPSDPDLESLPSTLLVTATNAVNVSRKSVPPPVPTRGVMSRHSEPPGTPTIPRAALTRDPDSDAPPRPETPHRTPPFHRQNDEAPVSIPSDAVQSLVSTSGEAVPPKAYSSENDYLPLVQVRDDYAESDLARQRTRPPRSRREGWVESGTPPPIGELSEAAARIAQATSHPPYPPGPVSEPPPPKSSNGKWVGLALLGIAAVAGAFALGKRFAEPSPSSPSTAAPTASVSTAATTAVEAQVASNTAEETAPPAEPSATSEAPLTPPAAKVASPNPSPAKPVQRSVSPLSAQPTEATPPSNVASATTTTPATSPAPRPSAEPEKQPAAGTPGVFDASAAASALGEAANRASSCRQAGDPSGIARVTVTFANSGNAMHALVDGPPFAGTPTGGCIASTMRSATVPPFTGDRVTVKKTVVIQ